MPCSVGTTTRRNFGAWFMDMIRCSRLVFTLFSCPEYVLMTYHWNIEAGNSLKDLLDEIAEDEVAHVEERPDDRARDDDDDRGLRDLVAAGPLDLLQLGPGLADEASARLGLAAGRALLCPACA